MDQKKPLSTAECLEQAIQCETRIIKQLAILDQRATEMADRFKSMTGATRGHLRCHVNRSEGDTPTFMIFPDRESASQSTQCPTATEAANLIEERNKLTLDLEHAQSLQEELTKQIKAAASD